MTPVHAVEAVTSTLLVYGPLGVITLLAIFVAVQKDRELTKDRKSFLDKQECLAKAHKEEMHSLEERYVTKAESWMQQYHELAHSMNAVAEALSKKRG